MKKDDFMHVFFVCVLVGIIIYLTLLNQQIKNDTPRIDLPEEFNQHTISQDRAKPTELMAVYDTAAKVYIIEFMDK